MKKRIVLLLITLLIFTGCKHKDTKKYTIDEYYGTYRQEKIVYKQDKRNYDLPNMNYVIDDNKFKFEGIVKYKDVTYKEEEISDKDKERTEETLKKKYFVYSKDKNIHVTIYIGEEHLYIGNYNQYSKKYTYIVQMKQV